MNVVQACFLAMQKPDVSIFLVPTPVTVYQVIQAMEK